MLCALCAGVFRYVDQHFHTPESFLENTAQLADDADVRVRLFEGFREEIISIADGDLEEEDEDTGSLADFLEEEDDEEDINDPVTAERNARDEVIEQVLLDVFESPLYEAAFTRGLESVQLQTVRTAELEESVLLRDKGPITFNMRALYQPIWEQLAQDELTVDITTNEVPADAGVITIGDRDTTLDALWAIVRNGPGWRGLATIGAIFSLIGAIVVAERRPSRAIQFGGGMVGLAVVTIVIVFLIRFIVPLLANGEATGSTSAVVATYVANTWPLVRIMIRLAVMGLVLASLGGIARLIWPDDWVYSSVSDDRGLRSVMRRRGAPAAEPKPQQPAQQPVPAAAAVPAGYQGYPQQWGQQPYPAQYPQQWGQPYPGQYPPGYVAPYPVGPYAQPAPQQYQGGGVGRPTVPVQQVQVSGELDAVDPITAANGVTDALPDDAAQIVPKVVASAPEANQTISEASTKNVVESTNASEPEIVVPKAEVPDLEVTQDVDADDWAAGQDW